MRWSDAAWMVCGGRGGVAAWLAGAGCFPGLPPLEGDDADAVGDTADGPADGGEDAGDAPDTPDRPDGGACVDVGDCGHLEATCTRVRCLDGTCAAQPDDGAACDDGDPCTRDDTCAGFSCEGTAYACDDGIACTTDVCDGEGGCRYPLAEGFCHIGGACVAEGAVKADDPCRVCLDGEAWSPNDGAPCEDGDEVCTVDDVCEGLTCVAGGPPDDTEGDWAVKLVDSVAPQQSQAQAVHPIGLGNWLFIAEVIGGGSVSTSQDDVLVEGDQVVAVRRAPGATFVELRTDGFDRAAYVASDDWNGRVAMVLALGGAGSVHVQGSDIEVRDASHVVAVLPGIASQQPVVKPVDRAIQDVALTTDGGVAVAGTEQVNGLDDDPFVVKFDASGREAWELAITTVDYRTSGVKVAAVETGDVVVGFTFRTSAEVLSPQGSIGLTSSSSFAAHAFVRVGPQGEVVDSMVPWVFGAEPPSAFFASAPEIFTTREELILYLRGGLEVASERPHAVASWDRMSLLRLNWDAEVRWGHLVLGAGVIGFDGQRVLGAMLTGDEAPFTMWSFDAEDPSYEGAPESTLALFSVDAEGELQWVADYPPPAQLNGVVAAFSIAGRPSEAGVVMAGTFLGTSTQVHPTDEALTLTSGADATAFAARVNSSHGLACGAAVE